MGIHGDRLAPALDLCRALGPPAPDCAQGAYHDYWFAIAGADEAELPPSAVTDPRDLCRAQRADFVRPCWYRVFVDDRPEGIVVDSAVHLDVLCEGLDGLQRDECITAAVIGPADPARQLKLCAEFEDARDAVACIRGTKAQNLLGASMATYVGLVAGCETFAAPVRGACYRWLGKRSRYSPTALSSGRGARPSSPKTRGACVPQAPASSRARS